MRLDPRGSPERSTSKGWAKNSYKKLDHLRCEQLEGTGRQALRVFGLSAGWSKETFEHEGL